MAQTFVTGGSGFIGQRLVRRLVNEGHAVRALVRSQASADVVSALGADPVRGDLTDASTWRDQIGDSEVFFHLAAETDLNADHAQQQHVTVDGTRAAVEAARDAGVTRFVHCGSEAALLAGEPLVEADETAPLRPDSAAPYCAAKAGAEKIVIDANAPGFATVSIRPRFVWGPNSIVTDALVGAAKAGEFAWVEGGQVTTDITHVDNAVEGMLLGWREGRPGEAYFVTDQHRVVLREFLDTLFEIHGADSPTTNLSRQEAAEVLPAIMQWVFGQDCTLRTDKAVAELGYRPVVSYEDGLDAERASVT